MNAAIRANGVRYWLLLTWHTVSYYTSQRRWKALARAAWRTTVRGYYGELCQDCGRPYPLWWSSSAIYKHVVPEASGGGLFCPYCFDHRAERAGLTLQWAPHIFPFDHALAAAVDESELAADLRGER